MSKFISEMDFESVKEVALELLYIEPKPVEDFPIFCYHPYFESQRTCDITKKGLTFIDIYNDEEGLARLREHIGKQIRNAKDIYNLLAIIRTPYHLTFLKFSKPHLDKHTFSELLAFMWVNSENPNQDANVSISEFIRWFKSADKSALMSDEEYEYYSALPDEMNIYRGVAVGRAETKGLSWTRNFETASWFAHRFDRNGQRGYVLKGMIKKEDVFAYFNDRNEDEICCNSSKIYDVERIR